MPTYEYRCLQCGHLFELFQSMKDEPTKICPECQGEVQRLIGTGAGLIFKGSGFYITDYRSDAYKKDAKADHGPGVSGKSDTGGSGKSDTGGSSKTDAGGSGKTDAGGSKKTDSGGSKKSGADS